MRHDAPGGALVAARRAVAALFLLNAVAYANVVPRLPAIKADLGLSNTSLGTAVAAMPLGALISGPFAGWLIARVGSGPLAAGCGVAFGVVLPGFAVAPSWGALAATFLVFGALDSLMDVSMNAHALRVQRRFGRSIINSLHGLWSVGAVLGGLVGAIAAGVDVTLGLHLTVAGVLILLAALAARRRLLPGRDEADRDAAEVVSSDGALAAVGGAPDVTGEAAPVHGGGRRRATRVTLALLGLVVLMSAVVEDAPPSWGAVLMRTELGTSAAVAGFAFLAFQISMTIARFFGDWVVDRVGPVAVVRAGGLLTAAAVSTGLAIGEPATVVAGFALAGLGTASVFPLVFHAAGNVPGVPTGHGVAIVSWVGRIGFLVAPPIVGLVGDLANLRVGLALVPAAGLAIAALAGVLNRAAEPVPARPSPRPRRGASQTTP